MLIQMKIRHKGYEDKHIYKGNFALETMFYDMSEKYYGKNIAIQIQDLLKIRKE